MWNAARHRVTIIINLLITLRLITDKTDLRVIYKLINQTVSHTVFVEKRRKLTASPLRLVALSHAFIGFIEDLFAKHTLLIISKRAYAYSHGGL